MHVGSSRIRDGTHVSCIGRWVFYHWATREAIILFYFLIWFIFGCAGSNIPHVAQYGQNKESFTHTISYDSITLFCGQRSLASYSPWGHKKLDTTERLSVGASLVAQMVKNMPAIQDTQVWSLGQEDPLEKEMATHSSILAWRIPCTEEPGGLHSMALQRVRHDWVINTFTFPLPHPCIAPSPSFSLLVTSSLFSMSVSLFLVLFTRNHNQRKLTNLIT